MHINLPIVIVTCNRDIPMLLLQAESLNLYYNSWLGDTDTKTDLYIIVNEPSTSDSPELTHWHGHFEYIQPYYKKFNVHIVYRDQFSVNWDQFTPSLKNPWVKGWNMQQVLKFAIADMIDTPGYLVLDSQNFLIKPWGTIMYPMIDNKLPYRVAQFNMSITTWNGYCADLEIDANLHENVTNICTPIFLSTAAVKSLIRSKGSISEFADWFNAVPYVNSEFTLYHLWLESTGGVERYHYKTANWGAAYLRDHPDFDTKFDEYLKQLDMPGTYAWSSINHRAWGDMSDQQYKILEQKLSELTLNTCHFGHYRENYVHIKV